MTSGPIYFTSGAPAAADLNVRWISGSRFRSRNADPKLQVHACDPHTFILRQSKAISFEAPFLYLLFGNDRALLLDTGATASPEAFPLRQRVDEIMAGWLARNPRRNYQLVVAHTHGHNDHVGGDPQFFRRPDTSIVSSELAGVQEFFGFTDWPGQVVALDLGGRVLEVTGSPGHHPAAITVYDPWTGFLLTGDTVYPGRLHARDFPAFLASLERMTEFAGRRAVTHVLGCHIEMTTEPGQPYPLGSTFQPDEPPLQMTPQQLIAVRDAARSVAGQPGSHTFDDFVIMNGPCRLATVGLVAGGLWDTLRPRRRDRPAHAS